MYNPRSLDEFIGQKRVVKQVLVAMKSATLRQQPIPHILFAGMGGTGKTTLTRLIATTLGQRMILRMPATLKDANDVWHLFEDEMTEDRPLIYFIDEIHRLDVKIEEELYLPMENGIIVRKTGDPRLRGTYQLKPFSVIGATTNPGKLAEPFRSRFGLTLFMQPYTLADIEVILLQAAREQGIRLAPQAVTAIAARSRASPRMANHLLDRCRDVAIIQAKKQVDLDVVTECFELMGVDEYGLNETDRKYLLALYEAPRPLGANSLEPILHIDKESITRSLEPYLIEAGLVTLTSRGRQLSRAGLRFVEQNMGIQTSGLTKVADDV